MKVRIFPKTSSVKSIIQNNINAELTVIGEMNTELDKLNKGGSLILPDTEYRKTAIEAGVRQKTQYITELNTQMEMLDSHGKEEVMVEIDV